MAARVYMGTQDAEPNDDTTYHQVGVDGEVGLYVILGDGDELRFDPDVLESVYEALGDYLSERN